MLSQWSAISGIDYSSIREQRLRRRSAQEHEFQLVKSEIESLSPEGTYHLIANCEYRATRRELEHVFAKAMKTMSYRERGLFHQKVWSRAEQFRV